jgi:site-specific DNA recombinase
MWKRAVKLSFFLQGRFIMKIACYLRVSTTEQSEEGYSISAQKNRLEAFCTSQGWDVVRWYVDEGISAKDTKRPELQRLLKGVQKKAFDVVLVYRLDRLTRSVLDLYSLLQEFEKHNVKFKSATEVYDTTTATGRLFLTLIASLAQWERENLGERVSFGMEEKAKQGKWTVAEPPFGYRKNGEDLEIVESEAIIIRRIFKMYLSGQYGVRKIAIILNNEGIKTRNGSNFSDIRVRYFLSNPIYKGTMRYNYTTNTEHYFEVDNVAPPIIEDADFQQVQLIINNRKRIHPRSATSKHIFSGVLRCARCGKYMTGSTSNTSYKGKKYAHRQYVCNDRMNYKSCDQPSVSEKFLEIRFQDVLSKLNDDDQREKALSKEGNKKDFTNEIENINEELKKIDKRKERWQYAWVNEMISDTDFGTRMKEEEKKEKMLLVELEAFREKDNHSVDISIPQIFKDITNSWEYLTVEEKKNFVQTFFKSITVDKISSKRNASSVEIKGIETH